MRQHRDLHFGRARVALCSPKLLNYLCLTLFRNRHASVLPRFSRTISDLTTLSRLREYSMSKPPGCFGRDGNSFRRPAAFYRIRGIPGRPVRPNRRFIGLHFPREPEGETIGGTLAELLRLRAA